MTVCENVPLYTGCIKLPSAKAMLNDIKYKEESMASRYFSFSAALHCMYIYSINNLKVLILLFFQIRCQSEAHYSS